VPNFTPNLGLAQPLTSDSTSELRLSITGNASALDAYSLLTTVQSNSSSTTLSRGQSVIASPNTTQTLPSASANAMVAITASGTVTGSSPVTVSGSNIQGIGLVSASSFLLGTPGAYAILQSDGTNWHIVAGQQDTGWLSVTVNTGAGYAAVSGETPVARLVADRVWLRGGIKNPTGSNLSANAFTLPAAIPNPPSSDPCVWVNGGPNGGNWSQWGYSGSGQFYCAMSNTGEFNSGAINYINGGTWTLS
jgi:hypothetical protein